MQQLLGHAAGLNPDNSLLQELFLQRLPNQVQMVLASAGEMTLEDLAQLADKVMEVSSPSISSVSATPQTAEVEKLQEEVEQLRSVVSALQVSSRSRSSSRSRATSPHLADAPGASLCWYHRRFGNRARKCVQPCAWSGNAPASR